MVDEYRPGGNSSGNLSITELSSPMVVAGSALFDGMAVTPTVLGAAGRLPPNTIIDDDTQGSVEVASETTYDPEQDGIDFYESLEGMLVHIDDALVIAPTNQYGEVWVVAGDETLATLSVAIADAGGPDYSFIEITPVDGQDGGLPGGNIRVAYLYDASRVSLVDGVQGAGDSTTGTEATEDAGALALSLSPGRVDPGNTAWASTRKPLAALFDFKGQRLLLINNHWSSKGGSGYQFGAEQPFENGGQAEREAQAQVVNDFVDSVLAVDGNAQIVVVGDLNEFSFLPPLSILRGGDTPVLFDLIDELLAPQERYSYVFDGNSQTLDHALVSEALLDRTEFDVVHVNAQFVDQISDHDPTLMRISFDAEPDDFDFGAVPNAQAGAQVTSPSLTLSGFELSLPLEVSGGQYSLNGSAFSTAAGTAQAGDRVQLRAIASSTPGETRTVTLNLGDSSGSFELTTAAADEGDEDQDDDDDDDDGGALGWGMLALLGFAAAGRQRRLRV